MADIDDLIKYHRYSRRQKGQRAKSLPRQKGQAPSRRHISGHDEADQAEDRSQDYEEVLMADQELDETLLTQRLP